VLEYPLIGRKFLPTTAWQTVKNVKNTNSFGNNSALLRIFKNINKKIVNNFLNVPDKISKHKMGYF
jgi:hypothetical protein